MLCPCFLQVILDFIDYIDNVFPKNKNIITHNDNNMKEIVIEEPHDFEIV